QTKHVGSRIHGGQLRVVGGERVLQLHGLSRLAAHADGDGSSHSCLERDFRNKNQRAAVKAAAEPLRRETRYRSFHQRSSRGPYAATPAIRRASKPSRTSHRALAAVSAAASAFSAVCGFAFTRFSSWVRHTRAWNTSAVECNVK